MKKIGEAIATLIEDGSTLQMGIGAIPDATLACLFDRKDLGIHTEMFSEGVIDLVEKGFFSIFFFFLFFFYFLQKDINFLMNE